MSNPNNLSTRDSDGDTDMESIQLPAAITEHPLWKAIWRKLLTPRPDLDTPEREQPDAA